MTHGMQLQSSLLFLAVDSEHVGGESVRNTQMMQVRHESLHMSIASLSQWLQLTL